MEDRNSSQLAQNPFAALFPSAEKAEEYSKQHDGSVTSLQSVQNADTVMQTQPITVSMKEIHDDSLSNESERVDMGELNEMDRAWMLNDLLQRVFLITVDNGNNIFVLCKVVVHFYQMHVIPVTSTYIVMMLYATGPGQ